MTTTIFHISVLGEDSRLVSVLLLKKKSKEVTFLVKAASLLPYYHF